jgi:hypothetical protein
METSRKMHSGEPYQYKMNNKKRSIAEREGLANDEEEVEDLCVVEHIVEIMRTTYERKTVIPRAGTKGKNPIHVSVIVEPINPCATNKPIRTPPFRQPNFSGRKIGGSTSSQGSAPGGFGSRSSSQVPTLRGGSSSSTRMEGHDPIIRLPKFKGEASKEPEKHLFIYENI